MNLHESGIETYPVGLFLDLRRLKYRINHKRRVGNDLKPWRMFWRNFKESWKRKSYWNGYLAEWHYPPAEVSHCICGKGWTRARALKRLGVHIVAENLTVTEVRRQIKK